MWLVRGEMEPEPGESRDVPIAIYFRVVDGCLEYARGTMWHTRVSEEDSWPLRSWLDTNEPDILALL